MNSAVPYKLINRVQRYAWGQHGQASLIHRLLGSSDSGTLAAELWIGAHSSAPSELVSEEGNAPLDEIIARSPEAWLGEGVLQKFGANLPYLFKVLSVRTALSIQAHPDKSLAEELHRVDPAHYPDSNHKPEMAIAVTNVELLYGFRDLKEIKAYFLTYPELSILLSEDIRGRLLNDASFQGDSELLRDICIEIFTASNENLRKCTSALAERLRKEKSQAKEERWFLELCDEYPGDVGLLCFFLLNYVNMCPGDAIFVGPNTPHAYLRGDLLECMANSDNVVRAGLTNKYKDVETLLKMLNFRSASPELFAPVPSGDRAHSWRYPAPASEFHVELLSSGATAQWTLDQKTGSVIFCFEGKGKMEAAGEPMMLSSGEAIFIPADCPSTKLNSSGGKFYYIHVPV